MDSFRSTLLIALISLWSCAALPEEPSVTYDMLYSAAVESYSVERWYECTQFLQRALDDYKFYHDTLTDCRLKCKRGHPMVALESQEFELDFFNAALKRSDCLRRCKEEKLPDRPEGIAEDVEREFEEHKPYDYLQICAFKVSTHSKQFTRQIS